MKIRMWEFVPGKDETVHLKGVVRGIDPKTKPGDCGLSVEKTILTGPIKVSFGGIVLTKSGVEYRLDGSAGADLIEQAKEEKTS